MPPSSPPNLITAASPVISVQLWGDTNVGKTMLLSAAFGDLKGRSEAFPLIDFGHEGSRIEHYIRHFRLMKRGSMVNPTSADWKDSTIVLDLVTKNGRRIAVRDIQGSSWRGFTDDQRRALASDTDAILFLVAWNADTLEPRLDAVHDLLDHVRSHVTDHRAGLVFTQCDRALPLQLHRFAWADVMQTAALLKNDVVRRLREYQQRYEADHGHDFFRNHFDDRIWFTSAWGCADTSEQWSASVLTDFGDCLPCHIHPVQVREPFAAMFSALLQS